MRRIFATFLLLLVAWGSVVPLAIAAAADPIPACCRKDGAHHCQMGMRNVAQDGAAHFRAQLPDCPFRTQHAVPAVAAVLPWNTTSVSLHASSDPAFSAYRFLVASPIFGSVSQRGPPVVTR